MTPRARRFHPVVTAPCTAILTIWFTAAGFAQNPPDMDALFGELSAPDAGDGWRRAESDILRAWSQTGSATLDLLHKRGTAALDAGDPVAAIGHLTALTDHAPDFAAGFVDRAAAYAAHGDFGPAGADLARALQIEPRQFIALTQLGAMLEEMGDRPRALAAFRESLAINPHQPEAVDAVARLQRDLAGTAL